MKTFSRIIVILLIAAIVAGGWYLVANNTSLASGMDHDGDRPSMTDASGQTFQPTERHEGGEHAASLGRGLAGVGGTLIKITVTTIIVLLMQKAFNLVGSCKVKIAQS